MRLDSVADAITNSSSEIFTFGTRSLDEVYDALAARWDEHRELPETEGLARAAGVGWCLDGSICSIVTLSKDDQGFVNIREDEDYLLDQTGFGDVIRKHFGDLIIRTNRC